jgi:hypothetical protein
MDALPVTLSSGGFSAGFASDIFASAGFASDGFASSAKRPFAPKHRKKAAENIKILILFISYLINFSILATPASFF